MGCVACGRGFHDECDRGCNNCHGNLEKVAKSILNVGERGAPIKNEQNVKDRLSTGRKRAAQQYPIFEGAPCEWRGKKNCGGGQPIIGCINGIQVDRHHGPVKDPIHNEPYNVHRICKFCHNRWHAVNDPIYVEEEWAKTKHEPEVATEMELLANEAKWKMKL